MAKKAPIKVSVTFISCKLGGTPNPVIDQPQDVSEMLRSPIPHDGKCYDLILRRLKEVVQNTSIGLFFHKDTKQVCTLDTSALQHGAIYAPKEKQNSEKKVTKAKLSPIQSQADFDCHVKDVSTFVYPKKRGRKKIGPSTVSHYEVELCIVLMKESVTVRMSFATASSSEITPILQRKGKEQIQYFTIKARHILVVLSAPIETEKKKTGLLLVCLLEKRSRSFSMA